MLLTESRVYVEGAKISSHTVLSQVEPEYLVEVIGGARGYGVRARGYGVGARGYGVGARGYGTLVILVSPQDLDFDLGLLWVWV